MLHSQSFDSAQIICIVPDPKLTEQQEEEVLQEAATGQVKAYELRAHKRAKSGRLLCKSFPRGSATPELIARQQHWMNEHAQHEANLDFVSARSHVGAVWECRGTDPEETDCGQRWATPVNSRVSKDGMERSGCPYCSCHRYRVRLFSVFLIHMARTFTLSTLAGHIAAGKPRGIFPASVHHNHSRA